MVLDSFFRLKSLQWKKKKFSFSFVSVFECKCVCVCVCVFKRQRERERACMCVQKLTRKSMSECLKKQKKKNHLDVISPFMVTA
jgi:hypothetical protein